MKRYYKCNILKNIIFKHLISHVYRIYFSINLPPKEFKIEEDTKCLILAPHSDDETIGCGGLLLKHPEIFDVYCLTNGFRGIIGNELTYEEKIATRRNEFFSVMDKLGVNYYQFFDDVDDKRLIMRYDKFKKINISQYDYIFIPNILDQHRDHKSVSILLNELLKERPYKKNLKIFMYEVWSALAVPNVFIDIEDVIDKKIELIEMYKSQIQTRDYVNKIRSLNSYRALSVQKEYVETYTRLDVNDFKKICKMYTI